MTDAARVRLRPYARDDVTAFAALLGDPEVMRYVGDGAPLAPGAARELFDKAFVLYATDPSFRIWAIDEDGAYAGHAELKRRTGRGEYELIYFLQRARWGRGLGGRVVDAILAVARDERLPFVIATVDLANSASLRLLEQRGFRHDAELSGSLGCHALRLLLRAQPSAGAATREQHEHDDRLLSQP